MSSRLHGVRFLGVVVAAGVAAGSAYPAYAQCPGPPPAFSELANQDPEFLQLCYQLDPGGGCPVPDSSPTPDASHPVLAQEAIIQATVPAGFTATSVVWSATFLDPVSGSAGTVWASHTTDDPTVDPPPYNSGDTVKFGATGLVPGADHRFRVSFCDANGCFCWSNQSDPVLAGAFAGGAPEPPAASTVRELEDTFRRLNTSVANAGGDGIGPQDVWLNNDMRIVDDLDPATSVGGTAEMLQGGTAIRTRASDHEHAFAEMLVRGVRNNQGQIGTDEYNVDLIVRSFESGPMQLKGYYLKLSRDPAVADGERALSVGRIEGVAGAPFFTLKLKDINPVQQPKCPINGPLPLEEDELDGSGNPTGRSKAVWLRFEIDDDPDLGEPILSGYVAWGCTSGGIEDCDKVCKFEDEIDDQGSSKGLFGQKGRYGFCSHHKTHFADIVRGGSIPDGS